MAELYGISCYIRSCYNITSPYRRLSHWGRVTHICVGNLAIIGSDNGLSPGRRQAIIWTNDGILLIGPLGTNCSEIWIGIQTFALKKIHLKMSSAKWRPFCLDLNVLKLSSWKFWYHRHSPCWHDTELRHKYHITIPIEHANAVEQST